MRSWAVMWQGFRQRQFPEEFRIAPASWPADLRADLQRIAELVNRIPPVNPEPGQTAEAAPPPLDDAALTDAVMGLWRAERRVDAEDPDGNVQVMRQLRRHVRAGSAGLTSLGVRVLNHDGEPFDPGMSLEVLAIQPEPDLSREIIIETVRPTIYLADRRIQMGQVIVGRPERPTDSQESPVSTGHCDRPPIGEP